MSKIEYPGRKVLESYQKMKADAANITDPVAKAVAEAAIASVEARHPWVKDWK